MSQAVVYRDDTGFVIRCYSLEEQYGQMVIQDLIEKALEEAGL